MRFRTLLLPAVLTCILSSGSALAGPCDAHFTFDGTLADSSGNGYDGIAIRPDGAAMPYDGGYGEGRNGQALQLDGSTAVRVPLDLSVESCPQVTIAAWVKFDDNPTKGSQYILSSGINGPALVREGVNLGVYGGAQRYRASKALRGGSWEFIAATLDYEAGRMTVHWRNRVYEKDISTNGTKQADVWIGAYDDNARMPVKAGLIDDVRLIGGILTADQVKQLRNNVGQVGVMPKPTGLDQGPPTAEDRIAQQGALPKLFGEDQPPDIGDGTDEVGVMPKLFGEDQPPDIGDGPAAADSGQRVMMGQADSLPGSGDLGESGGTPTSALPGGSRSTDRSADENLQQARDQNALPELPEGTQQGTTATAGDTSAEAPPAIGGYTLSGAAQRTPVTGTSGTTQIPVDLVDEPVQYISLMRQDGSFGDAAEKPIDIQIVGRSGRTMKATNSLVKPFVSVGREGATIGSVRGCDNVLNGRLVGLEVEGNDLSDDGTFGEYYMLRDERKPHCTAWNDRQRCRAVDGVATGIVVHFSNSMLNADKVIGIQLICREVVPSS